MPGQSCEPCFVSGCRYPLQCFPNPNKGPITQTECLDAYSPAQQQAAKDIGSAITRGAGVGLAGGSSASLEVGMVYGPEGEYGCYSTQCAGISTDVSISTFASVGLYTSYGAVAGSSTAVVENAGVGVASYSTSQIFQGINADPSTNDALLGTEDAFAIGLSPEDIVIPVSAGAYACDTTVDTVLGMGGPSELAASVCGNGVLEAGEACDDGDLENGDGCSSTCTIEPICGNGKLEPGEQCDDGNQTSGDGCSADCKIEGGAPTWVPIEGNVQLADNTPICAMVLANGQYRFSCGGTGAYNLMVPLDTNGQVTLFSFADGFAPLRVTLGPGGFPHKVEMQTAAADSPQISITRNVACSGTPNWVRLTGTVASASGQPLCAMVLANGHYLFSCDAALGQYDLTVPVDQQGQVTLFSFADGFQPYSDGFDASGCGG